MQIPDRRRNQAEERILPLINVVFLLLIFFLIVGSLTATEPFEVEPPGSEAATDHEPESLTVLMGLQGRFALNNEVLSGPVVLERLRAEIAQQPQTVVTLKADGELPANQLVRFTQSLHEAGVEKLRLLTVPEER